MGKTLNITNPKQKRRKGLPSSRACVVTTFVRGGALSRVAAPLCLGCRAIGDEEEEEEKKREEEAARSSNRGARVSVCVDGRGHHRRRPTHKTFPILYTNDKRKLSSRLSFAFCCVSRPTLTEAKHHHHHHHGWRRRAREAHEGTTTI